MVRQAMDIPRSDCLLKLWIPRVCHLCQHSLLSPPPSHLSQVSDILRKVDGNKCEIFQETNFSCERLGWGDNLTCLAPRYHRKIQELVDSNS